MGQSNALSFIPSPPIKALSFDAEGARLGVLGKDGRLKVWDAWEGRELFAPGDPEGPVSGWMFHPVRSELAVRSAQGGLQILDTVSWQEVRRLASGTNGVSDRERPAGAGTAVASSLVYDPAGTRLASWSGRTCRPVCDRSGSLSTASDCCWRARWKSG